MNLAALRERGTWERGSEGARERGSERGKRKIGREGEREGVNFLCYLIHQILVNGFVLGPLGISHSDGKGDGEGMCA